MWPFRWFLCLYLPSVQQTLIVKHCCYIVVYSKIVKKLSLVSVKLLKKTDNVCSGTHCVPLKSHVMMRILPIATLFMHCCWNIRNTRNQIVKGDCHTQSANMRLLSITILVIHTHNTHDIVHIYYTFKSPFK